ncbi:MAG: radical SAM family heme chaperone HemW [Gemmatimonadales bacterium]
MRHIYVHVPFCARRCSYCDFAIAVRKTIPARDYVDAVLSERDRRMADGEWDDEPLETLYLGGGTPSALAPSELARLVRALASGISTAYPGVEITLEANPDDVTADSVQEWMNAGVNRVSLGVQSFDDEALAWMHRTHSAGQSEEAAQLLRSEGIPSLSIDLIFALPDALSRTFRNDLSCAIGLDPDHISAYGLTVEPRTALSRWISRGAVRPGSEDRYAREFLEAHSNLTGAGYEHYEISNYAKPERRARHNSAYWTGRRYLGLGPSAHSFDGRRRLWNVAPWTEYHRHIESGDDPRDGCEDLSPQQASLERLYLGLRTVDGIPDEPGQIDAAVCARAVMEGWMLRDGGHVKLTPQGWLRLDEMIGPLTTCVDGG